jgi:3-oxoacyl-[acyl-carrier-protein] synthase II
VKLAITAMGAVFPGGQGEAALLDLLRSGASRIAPAVSGEGRLAAEIGSGLKDLVRRKGLASLSRGALLAAAGVEDLLASIPGAALDDPPGSCALVSGTAHGHLASKSEFHHAARRDGVRLVSPIVFPNTLINSPAGHAAILFGIRGPNSTVTSGRRSGLEAILRAETLLRAGRARRALALGSDEVSPSLLRALEGAAVGEGAPPGEAAAVLLIERPEDAAGAGRRARAIISGSGEANAVGMDLSRAIEDSLRAALEDARVAPADVSWVSVATGGGRDLDAAELDAVERVFENRAVPLAAPKAVFGEGFGSTGPLAVACAILAGFEAAFVPGTPAGFLKTRPAGFSASPRPAPPGPILVSSVEESGATCVVLTR